MKEEMSSEGFMVDWQKKRDATVKRIMMEQGVLC